MKVEVELFCRTAGISTKNGIKEEVKAWKALFGKRWGCRTSVGVLVMVFQRVPYLKLERCSPKKHSYTKQRLKPGTRCTRMACAFQDVLFGCRALKPVQGTGY
ncbi:hypothetical protein BDQ17DRAFT_817755 [Cyathus striatus]|nr:hypothetical protein BDQ17DRAFT_817755 [Cyathus striatus]